MKYVTVLDFEDGKVYQYENLEHLKDGWNMDKHDDYDVIEWYLDSLGHNLTNCEWMAHKEPGIITP